jgi:proteic killer suppression protein
MIKKFKNKHTKNIWDQKRTKVSTDVQNQALKRLRILDAAVCLQDLRFPPSNKLHSLEGSRKGQYSIRVNQKYRICFKWDNETNSASDVEFVDYH